MSTDNIRVQAISLWEELTGKSVNSSSYTFTIGGSSFDLYQANKRVQEAQAVGDDLTVALVVKTLAEQFAASESFTLADILAGNERLKARIDLVGRMNQVFSDTAAVTLFESFFSHCEGALAHYRELTPQTLEDKSRQFVRDSGCFVGLDAFHGIERLTRLMVTDGPVGDVGQAKVSRLVFAFDSIEDLITHSRQIPIGFSLCAILAPHASDSYFVMVVNTGGRIVVLTDKGNYSHPLQEARMRSRNDRYNLNRMEGSHFPYGLLNIKWHDNGRRSSSELAGTALIVSDSGLRVVGQLSDLEDWDLLWLHLFIDQCRHRYFECKIAEPQLATGSMIRLPHKWAEGSDQLPVPVSYELKLDARTSVELDTAFMHSIEPKWASTYNPNLWLEDRFAASVPDDCLYLPSAALNSETPMLGLGHDGKRELIRQDNSALPFYEANKLPTLRLHGMTCTALSTPERVIRDCHFLARSNQAEVISRLVKEDYDARKEEMQEWFYKAAGKYLPKLIDDLLALDHHRFSVDKPVHLAAQKALGNGRYNSYFRTIQVRYEPVRKQTIPWRNRTGRSLANTLRLIDYKYACYRCAVDRNDEAQLFISLDVTTVFDIMTVTGLALDQIPAELRHLGVDNYVGNSILDRIDPLADVQNPWNRLELRYQLPVSLKAFKAVRRSRGLHIPKATEIEAYARQQAEEDRCRLYPRTEQKIEGLE